MEQGGIYEVSLGYVGSKVPVGHPKLMLCWHKLLALLPGPSHVSSPCTLSMPSWKSKCCSILQKNSTVPILLPNLAPSLPLQIGGEKSRCLGKTEGHLYIRNTKTYRVLLAEPPSLEGSYGFEGFSSL